MTAKNGKATGKIAHRFRCAVYTRKSTEEGWTRSSSNGSIERRPVETASRMEASARITVAP